jgi:hypothetical protein
VGLAERQVLVELAARAETQETQAAPVPELEAQPGERPGGPALHPFTYDILPDSESGAYYAGGALIGSTLKS